jgi:hypothetical protein
MVDEEAKRGTADHRISAREEGEAAYFARRYGLSAEQLSERAKLEAAARRLMD